MPNTAPQDRIDPNVSIPPAVRAAAARSEELHRQSIGQGQTPPANDDPAKVANTNDGGQQPVDPGENKDPPPPGSTSHSVDWEHRYNSMKGRFEREAQARQQQASQIAAMQRELAELRTARPTRADTSFERLVTPEEERDYGAEFLSVVGKKAKEELSPELEAVKAELDQLKGQINGVNNVVAMTARERMEQYLDQQVPNWRDLNTDDDFNAWLDLPDVFSGGIRKQLLHAAYFRNDAPRVAAFFKGFINDEAATNPAKSGAAQQVTSAGNAKVPLETFAAPGRAKTAAAPAPAEKPFFTRAQISGFYASVNKGEYAGKEAERQRIEQEIFSAQREGRIRDR